MLLLDKIHTRKLRENANTAIPVALFVLLISAIWVEADTYRYIMFPAAIFSLFIYNNATFKPALPIIGYTCLAWAGFVAIYYIVVILSKPDTLGGSAEGIYLYPLIYASIGYLFFYYRSVFSKAAWAMQIVSFVFLSCTLQPQLVFSSFSTVSFLIHLNSIHAALAGSLILFSAFFFGVWIFVNKKISFNTKIIGFTISLSNFSMALIGILGANSKGVWVALVGAILFLFFHTIFVQKLSKKNWVMMISFSVLVCSFVLSMSDRIISVAGIFVIGSYDLSKEVWAGEGPLVERISIIVQKEELPYNLNVRIQLWLNAIQVWSQNYLLGNGIYWENLWENDGQFKTGHTLIHNSFLSIAIRFGIVGLSFYSWLFGWSIIQARKCVKHGYINHQLYTFFLMAIILFVLSMLTNSGHRLAIGETLFLLISSFGFCCNYIMQEQAGKLKTSTQTMTNS